MTDYQRIASGEQTPPDAVVVTVRSGFGRTVADVAAVQHIPGHPTPVHLALTEAEQLRERLGLGRVVVVIEDEKLWRAAWGRLLP